MNLKLLPTPLPGLQEAETWATLGLQRLWAAPGEGALGGQGLFDVWWPVRTSASNC